MAEPSYHVLIRHGAYHQQASTPSARQPYPLTDEGIAQARAGADLLRQMIAEHNLTLAPLMYCSHQLRAWQTAREIAACLKTANHPVTEVQETPDLAERGLGSAANLTVAQIDAIVQNDPRFPAPPAGWKSNSDYCLPLEGAESLMQAGQRVARHLRSTDTPGQVTVHVGHGAAFRHGAHHLGLLSRDDIARLSMFHARPLLICHETHDTWSHLAGAWKVRAAAEDPID